MPEKFNWFKRNRDRKDITPTDAAKERDYPSVIYSFAGDSPLYRDLIYAAYSALAKSGFEIHITGTSSSKNSYKIDVRSKSVQKAAKSEAALFLGTVEATKLRLFPILENTGDIQALSLSVDEGEQAENISSTMVGDLVSNQGLYEAFQNYYGGLRWGTDQDYLRNALFSHGTDLDLNFLDEHALVQDIESLVYRSDFDISYEERKVWKKQGVEWVLEHYPALDYRRLGNQEFRESEEGQILEKLYTQLCGEIAAKQYSGIEQIITKDGKLLPKPVIPLSRHPIFEALIADEVSLDKPKAKYDFGPSDLTGLILNSDSRIAHDALVSAINTRLPEEHRRVFDGPTEFQHKLGLIISLLRQYRDSFPHTLGRELLSKDVARVLEAYTGEGNIAVEARTEAIERMKSEYSYIGDVGMVPEIVTHILESVLASSDSDLVSKAQEVILENLPIENNEIEQPNPLAIQRSDLTATVLDALQRVTEFSHPEVFWNVSQHILGNEDDADQIAHLAELAVHAKQIRQSPQALRAFKHLRSFSRDIFDKGTVNPERDEAQRVYDQEISLAEDLEKQYTSKKNQLLLQYLEEIIQIDPDQQTEETEQFFAVFLDRLQMRDYFMDSLPTEYHELIRIVSSSVLSAAQRSKILWHIASQFKSIKSESEHHLVEVVFDMYKISLGEVEAARLPKQEDRFSFSAIRELVRNHGRGIFKNASQEQLQILEAYSDRIRNQAERVAQGAFLGEEESNEPFEVWQKQQIEVLADIARTMNSIQEVYQEFLRIEAVKILPHEYFGWLIEKLIPFWQQMNREVSPGNSPGGDVRRLFDSVKKFVNHVIELQERLNIEENGGYPEDFDCISDGNLESFLKDMYDQMVVPDDIKYNKAVWDYGLGFVHAAVVYMPEGLLEEIRTKYPGSNFAEYLRKTKEEAKNYE